jgi:NAD(P)-dependent dehydrogenase (short-subunit alcohol dehydrogenase family)
LVLLLLFESCVFTARLMQQPGCVASSFLLWAVLCFALHAYACNDQVNRVQTCCRSHLELCEMVCRRESIDAALQQVQAAVGSGGLQLLVNNAGIGMVSPVEFFDMQGFR